MQKLKEKINFTSVAIFSNLQDYFQHKSKANKLPDVFLQTNI